MSIFKTNETLNRLDAMIDRAIDGKPVESSFDETRVSALETKLARYLSMTGASRTQLAQEKAQINELISDISHQTKVPTANILLYAQLLQEADLCEKDMLCVNAMVEQAEKLRFLLASLLKASRLESGIISVAPIAQPLQPLLDSVLGQISNAATDKGIAVKCQPTDGHAIFDLKWTVEALYNLVDNALKYTPSGGSVAITTTPYQFFYRIDVSDTGIGIAEDEFAKVFSRFYRSQTVRDTEGLGIGLYLSREIISGDGGYIKVSSTVGRGSTFSVFLPTAP